MDIIHLMDLINDEICNIDMKKGSRPDDPTFRPTLEGIRATLCEYHRILEGAVYSTNTIRFQELTASLNSVNLALRETVIETEQVAKIIDRFTEFVGIVGDIVKLIAIP